MAYSAHTFITQLENKNPNLSCYLYKFADHMENVGLKMLSTNEYTMKGLSLICVY